MIDTFICLAEDSDRLRLLQEKGQYIFNVHQKISKTEVKTWIEKLFQVEVIGLNSKRPSNKLKRRGKRVGYPVRYKEIIVSLKQKSIKEKTSAAVITSKEISIIPTNISSPLVGPISNWLI